MKILKNTVLAFICICFVISTFAVVAKAEANEQFNLNIQMNTPVLMQIAGKEPTSKENQAFKEIVSSVGSSPYFALLRDYPDLTFWMNDASFAVSYSINGTGNKMNMKLTAFKYSITRHKNYTEPELMTEKLSNAVKSFTPQGDTVYEKVRSIHDHICEINTYLTEEKGAKYCFSAYGALIDNRSVCEGYAEAFKLLCNYNGIDCILVTGTASNQQSSGSHMWNYVRMDDGKWYAVDCTWDDAGDIKNNTSYFLVGSDSVINGKTFSDTHLLSTDFQNMSIEGFEYPELSSTSYEQSDTKIDYEYDGIKYYYSFLNDAQKEVYISLLTAAKNNSFNTSDQPKPDTSDNVEPPQTPSETTPEGTTETTPEVSTTPEITETKEISPNESSKVDNEDKPDDNVIIAVICLSVCSLSLMISRRSKK